MPRRVLKRRRKTKVLRGYSSSSRVVCEIGAEPARSRLFSHTSRRARLPMSTDVRANSGLPPMSRPLSRDEAFLELAANTF